MTMDAPPPTRAPRLPLSARGAGGLVTQARMVPAELRARREYLGLTQDALGVALARDGAPVRGDTIRRWESGREPIPYRVPDQIEAVERRTDAFIEALRDNTDEQVFYDTDVEARFISIDWATARWWRHCIIRARAHG